MFFRLLYFIVTFTFLILKIKFNIIFTTTSTRF